MSVSRSACVPRRGRCSPPKKPDQKDNVICALCPFVLRSLLRAAVACCWLLVSSHSLTITTLNPCSRYVSGFYEARNGIITAAAIAANVTTIAEDIIQLLCFCAVARTCVTLRAATFRSLCCSLSLFLSLSVLMLFSLSSTPSSVVCRIDTKRAISDALLIVLSARLSFLRLSGLMIALAGGFWHVERTKSIAIIIY